MFHCSSFFVVLSQVVILVTSVVNVWYSSSSIASSSGLPLLNQSLSWTILGKSRLTICPIVPLPPLGGTRKTLCFYVVRPSFRPSVMLFLQCLWYALTDFHQTFVSSASWDEDELVVFWGQKVKVKLQRAETYRAVFQVRIV